ncbi:MAG TPA: SDR family oxidoreductase [Steroidobacteraceae bacterium]|nr:SDR family oxidoreductase [Steroidobacteraceae bacterium]
MTDSAAGICGTPLPLAGRHAVVSGAGGGIGSAVVRTLLTQGAIVHALDRDGRVQLALADRLAAGAQLSVHEIDLADRRASDRALERLLGQLPGRCDILVNNAGIAQVCSFERTPDELLDALLACNFSGHFRLTRQLLPALKASGHAAVVNIASELALIGQRGYSAYSATKGAMLAWSRALAIELAPERVRVNAVCPGPVDTPMLRAEFGSDADPVAARAGEIATVPLGRLGEAAEIASVVAFLASDAAGFVTGAAWSVDGGKTAR